MSVKLALIAHELDIALRRHGFTTKIVHSRSSCSIYVHASNGRALRTVRVSDHAPGKRACACTVYDRKQIPQAVATVKAILTTLKPRYLRKRAAMLREGL